MDPSWLASFEKRTNFENGNMQMAKNKCSKNSGAYCTTTGSVVDYSEYSFNFITCSTL